MGYVYVKLKRIVVQLNPPGFLFVTALWLRLGSDKNQIKHTDQAWSVTLYLVYFSSLSVCIIKKEA